ncbi:MAG TPA: flavodoxin domain-containing protein [Candidatus Dormibacteraeota bacterium]|nr:flavodoxin domain-containing protein [Candidatus Dormibacteraeota bacterium]
MNSTVLYGSRYGNTRRVAEAVAGVLRRQGEVRLLPVEEAAGSLSRATDLLVVGGPTEGHAMTPAVAECLDQLASAGLHGVPAAAFDTRLRWPRRLSGSAASDIAARLRRAGAQVLEPEGSFLVTMRGPALRPGELERAEAWAASIATAAARHAAPARR